MSIARTRVHKARVALTLMSAALLAGPVATRAVAQTSTNPKPAAKAAASPAVKAAPRGFVVASDGNQARYRVRERLMNREIGRAHV